MSSVPPVGSGSSGALPSSEALQGKQHHSEHGETAKNITDSVNNVQQALNELQESGNSGSGKDHAISSLQSSHDTLKQTAEHLKSQGMESLSNLLEQATQQIQIVIQVPGDSGAQNALQGTMQDITETIQS